VEIERIYREHAPQIAASLAKAFGPARLDLIESAVQEAFVAAIEQWGDTEPQRPAAWLHEVARRRLIDALRRAAKFSPADDIDAPAAASDAFDDGDLLMMMFACCHPAIAVEGAVALALRTLCGFPIAALCRALRAEESAVEKRLARARAVLREESVEFAVEGDLDSVLRTLYVLFLEGYSAHAGAAQIDAELCASAIRLCDLLLASRFASPQVHALQALFLLQASRLAARIDDKGDLIPLHAQDRARWDRDIIARGMHHLAAASSGDTLTAYHLEAAIAACHALAPSYDATDWPRIVELYDKLLARQPSPVVALQRAIAIGRASGARAGLRALELVNLDDDPVLAAAQAELSAQLGDTRTARIAYQRALELAATEPERRFLEAKLAALRTESP